MVYYGLVERLVSEMEQMEIADAHEHLPPESERVKNYHKISEKMGEMNKPGIYTEILIKRCKAKFVLTQAGANRLC